MTARNLTHPKFQPPELNTKLIQIAEAIQLLSDVGVLDLSGGGTGFSSYTLGDLLYGSASTALAKLAGNITTARQFLRQAGTGLISAAPAWDTIVAGDIPSLDASKITTGQLALARGGSAADLSATGGASQVVKQVSAGAALTVGTLSTADLSDRTESILNLSNGDNNNVTLGTGSYYFINGPTAAYAITGITGGSAGRVIVLTNNVVQTFTLKYENASSTAANRNWTPGAADLTVGALYHSTILWYSTVVSRWLVAGVS